MSPPLSSAPPLSPATKRVAHLVRPAEGGMRAQVKGLLAAFPESLLAAPPDVCDFCADVMARGDVLRLPTARRPDQLLVNGLRAGKWAKQRGAHLLHGHGLQWTPLFALAQAVSGLPLVVTLHNLVPGKLSAVQTLVLRAALHRADCVVCVSQAVAQSAKAIVGAAQHCVVVRNGIDMGRCAARDLASRADIRAALNVPPGLLMVLCIARLSPEKGLETLLRAVALLRLDFPTVRVFIAGDGPQKKELNTMAHDLSLFETVTFLGARDDVPALLHGADLYVQPSLSEGLGLAVLEAMASGLPVVASRTGGLPEVVAHDETGLLVPSGDAPALAGALRTLLCDANRRAVMGKAGRARAASQFGTARMISETQAVYEAALAGRDKRRTL